MERMVIKTDNKDLNLVKWMNLSIFLKMDHEAKESGETNRRLEAWKDGPRLQEIAFKAMKRINVKKNKMLTSISYF